MSAKILVIPWGKNDVWTMLEMLIESWGYTSVFLDTLADQVEFSEIERACQKHQPKVLITYLFDWTSNESYGFGNRLCDKMRKNPKTKDIKLIYFFVRDDAINDFRGPEPCLADAYMSLPFDIRNLEQELHNLIS